MYVLEPIRHSPGAYIILQNKSEGEMSKYHEFDNCHVNFSSLKSV